MAEGSGNLDITSAVEKAIGYLENREYARAESMFASALARDQHYSIRNNLALAQFYQGKYSDALKTLEPVLGLKIPNPVARSLAAQCSCAVGKTAQAKMYIQQAISDFDFGMQAAGKLKPKVWRSYAVFVFRALGSMGDAKRICRLAEQWRKYKLPEEAVWIYGAANFNLGKFKRAGLIWGKLPSVLSLHTEVADFMEQGVIPPFVLDYSIPHEPSSDVDFAAYVATGSGKLMLLSFLLAPNAEGEIAELAVHLLIAHGGRWGEQLGRGLLESPVIAKERKYDVLDALVHAGVIADGEVVQVWIDGEIRFIRVREEGDFDEQMQEAHKLAAEGNYNDAAELLKGLTKDGFKPHVYINLVQCLFNAHRDEEAAKYLQELKRHCSDLAITHYLDATYLFKDKQLAAANRALAKVKGKKGYQEIKEQADKLAMIIAMGTAMKEMAYPVERRIPALEKALPVDPTLGQGMQNLPVEALRTACNHWGLDGGLRRKEVQSRLIGYLSTLEGVKHCWRNLQHRERELLAFLLANGGWARLYAVTRRYGTLPEEEDFTELPASIPGRLWTLGLIFIGSARINGRRTKIAAVSVEVRKLLAAIPEAGTGLED